MTDDALVEAYRALTPMQAHMVANFLREAGIPATVHGDLLQGVLGELPFGWSTAPKVMVMSADLAAARAFIEAAEASDDEPLTDEELAELGYVGDDDEDLNPPESIEPAPHPRP
jgi:hypothetical protein